MSEKMYPIPFASMMNWAVTEYAATGDLFGVRQSGDLEFHLADIFADADILKAVSDEVKKLMDKDPLLEAEENQELKRKMNGYLERGWEKVNL